MGFEEGLAADWPPWNKACLLALQVTMKCKNGRGWGGCVALTTQERLGSFLLQWKERSMARLQDPTTITLVSTRHKAVALFSFPNLSKMQSTQYLMSIVSERKVRMMSKHAYCVLPMQATLPACMLDTRQARPSLPPPPRKASVCAGQDPPGCQGPSPLDLTPASFLLLSPLAGLSLTPAGVNIG